MTMAELLSTSEAATLLSPQERARVEEACRQETQFDAMPWYLRTFMTIGAWFSSGFLFTFLFTATGWLLKTHGWVALLVGFGIIWLAVRFRREARQPFVEQVCLSLSVTGHLVCLFALANMAAGWGAAVLLLTALAALLYFWYPDGLHRFLSTLSALTLSTGWICFRDQGRFMFVSEVGWWWHASFVLHVGAILWIFLSPRAPSALRPLGYAAAISLATLLLCPLAIGVFAPDNRGYDPLFCLPLIAAIPLVATGREGLRAHPGTWFTVGLALAVLALGNGYPTLVALLYLVLGFRLQERALTVLGALLALTFATVHYYNLEESLLHKSLSLMASGASLLLLRLFLSRGHWQEEARTA